MALPYTIQVTCVVVAVYPGDDHAQSASDYAYVVFEVSDSESSADEIREKIGGDNGRLVFRITQAQKDDFTEGDEYTISISAV